MTNYAVSLLIPAYHWPLQHIAKPFQYITDHFSILLSRSSILLTTSAYYCSGSLLTSVSRVTPNCSLTVCCTCLITASACAQVPCPTLTTKPQCFSDTMISPTRYPFNPASSINLPAKYPSGRLNVLPALGNSSGCFEVRFSRSSLVSVLISYRFPSLREIVAPSTR